MECYQIADNVRSMVEKSAGKTMSAAEITVVNNLMLQEILCALETISAQIKESREG